MQWSDERILTTHTGSLPRPPELTRLYVQRARGDAVDPAELDRIGEVRYIDDSELKAECADFRAALDERPGGFVEPFMTAPSPGIIAAAMKNEHYDTDEAYLAALAAALKIEYETIVANGFLLQLDCPDLALERHLSYNERPLAEFLSFVERVVATINDAIANIRPDRIRLHVCWGNYEGPHDRDVPLEDILPILQQAKVGGFVLPS